jgi:hypothetical protein
MDAKYIFTTPAYKHHLQKSLAYASVQYLKSRLYVVDTMLSDFTNEKQLLELMIEQAETKLCPVCEGDGSVRNFDDFGDTTSISPCKHCNNSGLNPKK